MESVMMGMLVIIFILFLSVISIISIYIIDDFLGGILSDHIKEKLKKRLGKED